MRLFVIASALFVTLACTSTTAEVAPPTGPTAAAKVTTPDEAIATITWNSTTQTDMAKSWSKAPSPAAQHLASAWLVYVQLQNNDAEGATASWAKLTPELAGYPNEWPATPDLAHALSAIRFLSEDVDTGPQSISPVPCSILAKHAEAQGAFDSVWGSTKDSAASSMRQACVPSDPAFDKAFAAFMGAIEGASPLPDGTMYQSMAMSSYQYVQWALIQPGVSKAAGDEAARRDAALSKVKDGASVKAAADALAAAMVPMIHTKDAALDAKAIADAAVAASVASRLSISDESME